MNNALYANVQTDLVLIGGGHTNLNVLKNLAKKSLPGVRITLITDVMHTLYSGMMHSFLTGDVDFDQAHIDLNRLCQKMNVRMLHSEVSGIDPEKKLVFCKNRPPVSYDYLTVNCGSEQSRSRISGSEHALRVKPFNVFLKQTEAIFTKIRDFRGVFHLMVIGGGATGVEISVALRTRINYEMQKINLIPDTVKVFLCIPDERILPGFSEPCVREAEKLLKQKNVLVLNHSAIHAIDPEVVHMADRKNMAADAVIMATGAGAPEWVESCGLETDEKGFIKCKETLQTVSYPNIFVGGDIASFENPLIQKSGVYAIRMAKVMTENIISEMTAGTAKTYNPQKKALYILGIDSEIGVLSYGSLGYAAPWVKKIKNFIDGRYMQKFAYKPISEIDLTDRPESERMRCGGCGGKVGQMMLTDVLRGLQNVPRSDVVSGVGEQMDSSCIRLENGRYLYQSIDFFREVVSDPHLFGKITALHCLNDLYASKATPHSALAVMGVPYGQENIRRRDIEAMLNGITDVLAAEKASLIGGHTAETSEFCLGLSVNGFSDRAPSDDTGVITGYKMILTKKIGAGVLFAADMNGDCPGRYKEEMLEELLISSGAMIKIIEAPEIYCTDITGFGLLGGLYNRLKHNPAHLEINLDAIPVFSGTLELANAGYLSTMHENNTSFEAYCSAAHAAQNHPAYNVLFDPQTAGPLLLMVPEDRAAEILQKLKKAGFANAAEIGSITEQTEQVRFGFTEAA